MNMLLRVKMALTESNPTIKPYDQDAFVKLLDYDQPVDQSLQILEAIHKKVVILFSGMSKLETERIYTHPGDKRTYSMNEVLSLYAWHGKHHLAQIQKLLNTLRS